MRLSAIALVAWAPLCALPVLAAEGLPFNHKVEVFRDKETDVTAFTVRLEQPFLAEEFEKSNYLRLQSADQRAHLIYPKETTFQQKHAEFYGRLRGEGKVRLQLSYEMVTENPDGSRRVQVRQGEIEVSIPTADTGPKSIYTEWANQQNRHFVHLLRYCPEESFFQYLLLQSQARYGVQPPPLPAPPPAREKVETDLYHLFSGSLAIQETLQRETYASGASTGDLNVHVSTLQPPVLRSINYKELLEQKLTRDKVEPRVAEISRLVPEDQYLLQFNSMQSLGEALDLSSQWGNSLLRLATVQAKDQRLEQKVEEQLCLRRGPLTRLFADAVISEVAVTGADPFVLEGADVTMIFRLKQPEVFRKAAAGWLEETRKAHPDLADAEFNYRGHKVAAHYTNDRVVSSFVAEHKDYVVYSNSHRAVRRCIDAATAASPGLYDALDYRYVSILLPPSAEANAGYFFMPEAMIRRLTGPASKISEKRRLQCYNNLVMLNNASLFYRLEYGRSPGSLTDLIEGRFVNPDKVVCPHGGAYTFDAAHDSCACSLHNRLKYLTPNAELTVLNVSRSEAAEYDRYKQRYQAFWQGVFDPVAVRIAMGPRVKLETCVLPFANGSLYRQWREALDKTPRPISTARIAPSAIVSTVLVPGRKHIADLLRNVPGVDEVLKANPTLTDLSWVGDRLSIHFCDGRSILEVDPVRLRPLQLPFAGNVSVEHQTLLSAAIMALKMPVYAAIDIDNRQSAAQLLEQLSHEVVLKRTALGGLEVSSDAYRLPDYKQHPVYVFGIQVYAIKLRLHVALVGDQLVVATKPEVLREVIDASTAPEQPPVSAHVLLRLNRRGLSRAYDEVQLYWAEKSRTACHRNISSIYNLCKLYGAPVEQVPRLSEAKYGVRYFCPDEGAYRFDQERDQVLCSVHGNREQSCQCPPPEAKTSFQRFMESIDEITASLRFEDESLIATVEIARSAEGKK